MPENQEKKAKTAKVYGFAETVEQIALQLIPTYHPELATARILYVYVNKASKKSGKAVLGKARRISGVLEFLLEKDFMIEVALDCWQEATPAQHQALVDHLLERCTGEEDDDNGGAMKWAMREPDVHEFTSILNRHGAWTEGLTGMVEVASRLKIEARADEVVTRVRQQQQLDS